MATWCLGQFMMGDGRLAGRVEGLPSPAPSRQRSHRRRSIPDTGGDRERSHMPRHGRTRAPVVGPPDPPLGNRMRAPEPQPRLAGSRPPPSESSICISTSRRNRALLQNGPL